MNAERRWVAVVALASCAIAVLSLRTTAHAQTTASSELPARVPCDTAISTASMRQCFGAQLLRAEQELRMYRKEARAVAGAKGVFDSAEAAWRRYRSLACKAASSGARGGTMRPVAEAICAVQLTERQTFELWSSYRRTSSSFPDPTPPTAR